VPSAYGAWPLESLDAHGGWISSSVELVRFAAAFDNPAKSPLLSEQAIAAMFAPPVGLAGNSDPNGAQDFYAGGWQVVRPAGGGVTLQMHSGSLPGTNTMLVRRSDGRNFAVLFNARETPRPGGLSTAAAAEINRVLDGIKELPAVDFFEVGEEESR
jgi:N-acyl-D-amino-acid deacylase